MITNLMEFSLAWTNRRLKFVLNLFVAFSSDFTWWMDARGAEALEQITSGGTRTEHPPLSNLDYLTNLAMT